MLYRIPTYVVEYAFDPNNTEDRTRVRVPQDKLDVFVQVLTFNDIQYMVIVKETEANGFPGSN